MTGRITGISGPTVSVDMKGLKLYELVHVGNAMLTGEVIKLEEKRAIVQVYEDTRGLGPDEPVQGTGMSMTVKLGPGLLSGMFDGLQRPLYKLKDLSGPFIRPSHDVSALDPSDQWVFHPLRKKGDEVSGKEIIGYVEENHFQHFIACPHNSGGRLSWIADGICVSMSRRGDLRTEARYRFTMNGP
jgi:V/A-type H+-transporting ATPase subunit A